MLLRDPKGSSLSSRQAINPPSCPASTPPKATLTRNQSYRFAQSATNHIAAGGLPQRLHYMVPIVEGQTHLPKSGANHAGSPVYGEPSSGIRGRIGDLPQALLSRIWHSDCTTVDNGVATICDIQAGRRCIHSRCAPDDPDSTPAREPIQEAFDWPFCSEPFPPRGAALAVLAGSFPSSRLRGSSRRTLPVSERRKRPHMQPCGAPMRRTGATAQKRPVQRFLLPWHGFRRMIGVAL